MDLRESIPGDKANVRSDDSFGGFPFDVRAETTRKSQGEYHGETGAMRENAAGGAEGKREKAKRKARKCPRNINARRTVHRRGNTRGPHSSDLFGQLRISGDIQSV